MRFSILRPPSRLSIAAVALTLAVTALAGCSTSGTPAPPEQPGSAAATAPRTSTAPAWQQPVPAATLDLPRARPAMADYDRRNNAAIARHAKTFEEKVWNGVDIGPLLPVDVYQTRSRRFAPADAKLPPALAATQKVTRVYADDSTTYPRAVLVAGPVTRAGEAAPAGRTSARVMVQTKAGGPWFNAASHHLDEPDLPAPAVPGATARATATQRKALLDVRVRTIGFLERQTRVTTADLTLVSRSRAEVLKALGAADSVFTYSCLSFADDSRGAFTVWRHAGGAIGSFSLRCTITEQSSRTGYGFRPSEQHAKVYGVPRELQSRMTYPAVVAVLVDLPAGGKPRVVAVSQDQSMQS